MKCVSCLTGPSHVYKSDVYALSNEENEQVRVHWAGNAEKRWFTHERAIAFALLSSFSACVYTYIASLVIVLSSSTALSRGFLTLALLFSAGMRTVYYYQWAHARTRRSNQWHRESTPFTLVLVLLDSLVLIGQFVCVFSCRDSKDALVELFSFASNARHSSLSLDELCNAKYGLMFAHLSSSILVYLSVTLPIHALLSYIHYTLTISVMHSQYKLYVHVYDEEQSHDDSSTELTLSIDLNGDEYESHAPEPMPPPPPLPAPPLARSPRARSAIASLVDRARGRRALDTNVIRHDEDADVSASTWSVDTQ